MIFIKQKKNIASLLVILLLISLFPVNVFATDTNPITTFNLSNMPQDEELEERAGQLSQKVYTVTGFSNSKIVNYKREASDATEVSIVHATTLPSVSGNGIVQQQNDQAFFEKVSSGSMKYKNAKDLWGYFVPETDGTYTFRISKVDNGARIKLYDGFDVVEDGIIESYKSSDIRNDYEIEVDLIADYKYPIGFDYFDWGGDGRFYLEIKEAGSEEFSVADPSRFISSSYESFGETVENHRFPVEGVTLSPEYSVINLDDSENDSVELLLDIQTEIANVESIEWFVDDESVIDLVPTESGATVSAKDIGTAIVGVLVTDFDGTEFGSSDLDSDDAITATIRVDDDNTGYLNVKHFEINDVYKSDSKLDKDNRALIFGNEEYSDWITQTPVPAKYTEFGMDEDDSLFFNTEKSPEAPVNQAIKYTGYIMVDEDGEYVLGVKSDDGIFGEIDINGEKTVFAESWKYQGPSVYNTGEKLSLEKNVVYPIYLEYFEARSREGDFEIQLSSGSGFSTIPTHFLYPTERPVVDYPVTFLMENGSYMAEEDNINDETAPKTNYYSENTVISLSNPRANEGYVFKGWSINDKMVTPTDSSRLDYMSTTYKHTVEFDTVIKAVFEKYSTDLNRMAIHLDGQDTNSIIKSEEVVIGWNDIDGAADNDGAAVGEVNTVGNINGHSAIKIGNGFNVNSHADINSKTKVEDKPSYFEKTFAFVFETGSSVAGTQVIFEQGGNVRGYNLVIHNGQLYATVYNEDEWNTNSESDLISYILLGDVEPNTVYKAYMVHDNLEFKAYLNSSNEDGFGSELSEDNAITTEFEVKPQFYHPNQIGVGRLNGQSVFYLDEGKNPDNTSHEAESAFKGLIGEVISWNSIENVVDYNNDTLNEKWDPEKITDVEKFDNIEVDWGTAIGDIKLPTEAVVTLEDGSTKTLPIVWDTSVYESVTGTYELEGEIILLAVEGIVNPDGVKAEISIEVARKHIFTAETLVHTETYFEAETSTFLPTTVIVTLIDNTEREVEVDWNEGEPTYEGEHGEYIFTGTLVVGSSDDFINSKEVIVIKTVTIVRPAPEVSTDEINDKVDTSSIPEKYKGMELEYTTDGENVSAIWTTLTSESAFEGYQVVKVRYKAVEEMPASPSTPLVFKEDQEAPVVEADDANNLIVDADATMEWKLEGDKEWTKFNSEEPPTFNGYQDILVRYAETEEKNPSEAVELNFIVLAPTIDAPTSVRKSATVKLITNEKDENAKTFYRLKEDAEWESEETFTLSIGEHTVYARTTLTIELNDESGNVSDLESAESVVLESEIVSQSVQVRKRRNNDDGQDTGGDTTINDEANALGSPDALETFEEELTPLGSIVFNDPYVSGYADGTFRPGKSITRAEMAAIFARILKLDITNTGEANFTDVSVDHWSYKYIQAASDAGIFRGYEQADGTYLFKPQAEIKRSEMAVVFVEYWNSKGIVVDGSDAPFTDVKGHWGSVYINKFFNAGVTVGFGDGTFRPDAATPREQAVVMVNGILGRPQKNSMIPAFLDANNERWSYGDIEAAVAGFTPLVNVQATEEEVTE